MSCSFTKNSSICKNFNPFQKMSAVRISRLIERLTDSSKIKNWRNCQIKENNLGCTIYKQEYFNILCRVLEQEKVTRKIAVGRLGD